MTFLHKFQMMASKDKKKATSEAALNLAKAMTDRKVCKIVENV